MAGRGDYRFPATFNLDIVPNPVVDLTADPMFADDISSVDIDHPLESILSVVRWIADRIIGDPAITFIKCFKSNWNVGQLGARYAGYLPAEKSRLNDIVRK